jgi:adenylate cyclase
MPLKIRILFLFLTCFNSLASYASTSKSKQAAKIDSLYEHCFRHRSFDKSILKDINTIYNYGIKHKDKLVEAKGLYLKGKYQTVVGQQFDSANYYISKSFTMYDSLNYLEGKAACYLQMGLIQYTINDHNEAINYFKKAIRFNNYALSKATPIYLAALSYTELKKFDTAILYFENAIKEYTKEKNTTGINMCEMFIGNMYNKSKDYQSAVNHLNNIIGNPQTRKDSFNLSPAFAFISTSYYHLNDYKNAIKNAEIAYNFIRNYEGSITYYEEALISLHESYKAIGNKERAYFYLAELSSLRDSILSLDILKGISKAKSNYEYQLKLNENKLAQVKKDLEVDKELSFQKTLRNSFLIGFALVGIFALVIYSQRNKIRKSKQRSDELLLNILPFDVAEELKENGYAEAKQFDQVSVIFTDFKGFTEISQELSPKELVSLINEHFSEFDKIMQKNGIEKIKTIGDAYMAVGGLPVPNSSHPYDVINAAIQIQEYLSKINKIKKENKEIYFEARIGIHTGSVVAGIVGLKKFSYDVWGDTVNTASRIESKCEEGRINISASTYQLVKDMYSFEYRGKVEAKGKGLIDMYYVNT